VLCGSVDARRAGEYMAEVRTSSQSERPCAGIEETRKPPGDAGGSSSPVNGDDHTGKRLAGKPHEPFERADGGRAKARPPPTLHRAEGSLPGAGCRESEGRPKIAPSRKAGGSGKHHGRCCPPRYRLADTNRSVLHIEQGTRSRRYRWPRSRPSSSSASWTCLRRAIPTSRWIQSSQ
jgi:hypothetical protein